MKVMRDGRSVTVDFTSAGDGLISHAGTALLARGADKLGLTGALSSVVSQARVPRVLRGLGVRQVLPAMPRVPWEKNRVLDLGRDRHHELQAHRLPGPHGR